MFDQAPIESAITLIDRVDKRPIVVGVDGQGGAGKSTFAEQLVSQLDRPCALVHGDDFYRDMPDVDRVLLDPVEGVDQYFDWQRLRRQVLDPVHANEPWLRYQRYDWDAAAMGDWIEQPMPEVVVVEGVYTLRPQLLDAIDVSVYVLTSNETRLLRQADRGENSNEWIQRWVAAEDHYVSSFGPQFVADIVIDGNN